MSCVRSISISISIVVIFTYVASALNVNSDSGNDADLILDQSSLLRIDSRTDVCQSEGCIRAADSIKRNIDETVNPCKDFHKFACGGWIKNYGGPYDSIFSEVEDQLNSKLKNILQKQSDEDTPDYIIKLKKLFRTCMLVDHYEYMGNDSLKWILEEKLGGWPLAMGKNWDTSAFDWMDLLIKFRKIGYGHNIILKLTVVEDPENSTANILKLEPSLGIDERNVRKYTWKNFQLIKEAAFRIYSLRDIDEEAIRQSLYLELHLFRLTSQCNSDEVAYQKYTVAELIKLAPLIDWLRYFREIVGYDINENETLLVTKISYFRHLGNYLYTSDKRALANFMIWGFIQESLNMLSEGKRSEKCLASIRSYMGVALSAFYLQEFFQEEEDQIEDNLHVKNISAAILQAFEVSLRKTTWIDSATKVKASNKARAIKIHTEYPMQLLNHSYLSDLYSNLNVYSVMYFFNMKAASRWKTDHYFLQLRKPNIKGDWKKYDKSPAIKPYYSYLENSIEFPAGVLQYGFFKNDQPFYLNFGALGYLIGREILRAFDTKGLQIDENGNKVKSWLLNQNKDNLEDQLSCLAEEYFSYIKQLNPWIYAKDTIFKTPEDLMAYSSGLKAAYEGYNKWSGDTRQESKLPGLNYTPKQLFWISAANVWCEREKISYVQHRFPGETYPNRYKVLAAVVSIPEFAEDFGCVPLQTQCRIW